MAFPFLFSAAGRKLLLDAFTVLLTHNLAKLGRHRYASMRSLSLVSLELCSAYRSLAIVQVRVSSSSVWHKFKTAYRSSRKGRAASRVPMPPRVLRMRWEISLRHLPKRESPAVRVIKWLGRLVRGRCFHPPKDRMVWPRSLQELTFGDRYFLEDGVMEKVVWPPCLKQLSFGDGFNQDIEGVVFPTSLERMYMGLYFDRPIEGVVWPPSLRQLEFGHGFNRPIEKVVWPDSMQELTFGFEFNQSIDRVAWPASLERLAFGRRFDQTIDNIAWPAALKDLQLWANPVEIPHFEGVNTRCAVVFRTQSISGAVVGSATLNNTPTRMNFFLRSCALLSLILVGYISNMIVRKAYVSTPRSCGDAQHVSNPIVRT